ncbi:MAG: hypothetical protein AABX38_07465 [Candidatus Micrarchaeota archaeon]
MKITTKRLVAGLGLVLAFAGGAIYRNEFNKKEAMHETKIEKIKNPKSQEIKPREETEGFIKNVVCYKNGKCTVIYTLGVSIKELLEEEKLEKDKAKEKQKWFIEEYKGEGHKHGSECGR